MPFTQIVLALATLLCSMVTGFLFAFAVVVMPGIQSLEDREFITAFREIDGIIQRGQPLFGLVWLGSVVTLVVAIGLGVVELAGADRLLLLLAAGFYLVGVQLPTFAVNIPLNNEIQALDIEVMDEAAQRSARGRFEARWKRWNAIRTALAVVTSGLLVVLLLRL